MPTTAFASARAPRPLSDIEFCAWIGQAKRWLYTAITRAEKGLVILA